MTKRVFGTLSVFLFLAFNAFANTPLLQTEECREHLTPQVVERVLALNADPAKTFAKQHPRSRVSEEVRCESALWRAPRPSDEKVVFAVPARGPIAGPQITPQIKRSEQTVKANDNNGNGNDGNNGKSDQSPGHNKPMEKELKHAGSSKKDLRTLPFETPEKFERPELPEPTPNPEMIEPTVEGNSNNRLSMQSRMLNPMFTAAAPPPNISFDGLEFNLNGNGHPPDTVGDVGPTYYIQSINTSMGIYRKTDGVRVAAFTLNTFMSQGHFGNLCDTNNFGDPVVLYDSFEDRWIVTDFAFVLSGTTVVNPPGAFQCFAVSMNGDPVSGGWNYYSINVEGGLGDYPKFGIWPDGLYMTTSVFNYPGTAFINPRAYAFNKAQMYAGAESVQVVGFNMPTNDFTVLPSNARLQTGTPPPGSPNYYVSTWRFLNALTVYKFHVDWSNPLNSTFTGPDIPGTATGWPNQAVANMPSLGSTQLLDALQIRAMMQNQYTNIGGAESLWVPHTVRRVLNGSAAPRFYQLDVTGGNVNPNAVQAATFDPDGNNVMNRWMPSLAVDRAGNMAIGYSTSNAATKPALKYAGRLATDPPNTFSQTEQVLVQGTGTQTTTTRWGDYAAMSIDPTDGCTFWFTSMYYKVDGGNHQTRIGSFTFPQCTPATGTGSVSGVVTKSPGGAPAAGATVALGSRITTANASGAYAFLDLPVGNYPTISASYPGYATASQSSINVTAGNTTTVNLVLSLAAPNACFTDTTQLDWQLGVSTGLDLTTAPGSISLFKPSIDQQNVNLINTGNIISNVAWAGQTFVPSVTGALTKLDVSLFCAANPTPCATNLNPIPSLTVSIRATAAGLPTGADLASAIIPPFTSASAAFQTVNFGAPPTLTAGTMYAIVVRVNAAMVGSVYAITRSDRDVYPFGTRVTSANSGVLWGIPLVALGTGTTTTDLGFHTFIDSGFTPSGSFVSLAKDSNPIAGGSTNWGSLVWTSSTPAGTTVNFQAAGSNSAIGPFNFVGPDGTAATFFTTSGASLSQFNGLRYLRYKALLSTTVPANTPRLDDVSLCENVTQPTTTVVAASSATYGDATASLSATLTSTGVPLSGKSISFMLNGNPAGSALTDASGTATVTTSITALGAGSYTIEASYAGALNAYFPSNGTNLLTIAKASSDSIVTVAGYSGVYDALPHGATGSAIGAHGEDLSGLLDLGASFINVPGGTANWTFAGNADYSPTSGSVAIIISKATLTVTANGASRLYGYANPTFTASYSGFQGTDTFASSVTGSPSFTTTATPASPAGTYTITVGLGTLASNNYSFAFVNGTLTVQLSGLIGLDSVSIGADKALADSFDSTTGYPASKGNNAIVLSNGTVDISGTVGGDVFSTAGAVNVQPSGVVTGNVSAGTTISNKGSILGTATANSPSGALAAPAVPNCGAFTAPANASGDLTVGNNSTTTLAAGTYCFHNLTLSGQGKLQVTGNVVIRLTGTLSASGGSIVNLTHSPSQLQIASSYAGKNGVTISGGPESYFTLYAPTTDVVINGSASFFGAALGKTLTLSGNPDAHYDVALPNVWAAYLGF